MNTNAFRALLSLAPVNPATLAHEHTAVHAVDLAADGDRYFRMGYQVRGRTNPLAAFAQRGNHRIELICSSVAPEREAFAVESPADWDVVRGAITARPDLFEVIEVSDDVERLTFRNILFRHRETGEVLQVVWRQTQVFTGVFR